MRNLLLVHIEGKNTSNCATGAKVPPTFLGYGGFIRLRQSALALSVVAGNLSLERDQGMPHDMNP